jgi:membrane associated rhomboid family serine protease
VAFFAHVGGFLFGLVAARVLTGSGRVVPQTQ